MMDALGLKHPTRFVIFSGRHMVIMPWTAEFFQPWTGRRSPILSRLPAEMQKFAGVILSELEDLPQF